MTQLLSPPANPHMLFLVGPDAKRLAEYTRTGTMLHGWVANNGKQMRTTNGSQAQFLNMLEQKHGKFETHVSANQCLSKLGA